MTDFNSLMEEISAQQEELAKKVADAKTDALSYAQKLIIQFNIAPHELHFADAPLAQAIREAKPKKKAPAKYRTPTGIEWSGRGKMCKPFREYLLSQGLTEADKDKFLIDSYILHNNPFENIK